jgi:hypothetical protein
LQKCKLNFLLNNSSEAYHVLQTQARPLKKWLVDKQSIVQYNFLEAKSLYAVGKYLEAANLCLPLLTEENITEEQRLFVLECATACSVLASVGERKKSLLSVLYKLGQCRSTILFKLLERMYLDQLITFEERSYFLEFKKIQLATLLAEEWQTALTRAILEHNLCTISKFCSQVRISWLGVTLGITSEKAEELTATMVINKQIKGCIDQANDVIIFVSLDEKNCSENSSIDMKHDLLNKIIGKIEERHPKWFQLKTQNFDCSLNF